MHVTLPCVPCLVRQAAEAIDMAGAAGPVKEQLLRGILNELAEADWTKTPVYLAQRLHRGVADDIATFQTGTHPALTASPVSYQLVNAAEIAIGEIQKRKKRQ